MGTESRFERFNDIWSSFLRPGTIVPRKSDIRPMAFGEMLADVSLVQCHAPGDYRFRLLGSGINQRMGSDPVGENVLSLMHPRTHDYIIAWFELSMAQPNATISEADILFERDGSHIVKSLALPLADDEGKVTSFIFMNDTWKPSVHDDFGAFQSLGSRLFVITPVDIGAGVPDLSVRPQSI